ncbi:MAG: nitroreductase [Gammaproteobacteria bacterium]|nr:nitroreductase [Gammaproteobacteria bacterium]
MTDKPIPEASFPALAALVRARRTVHEFTSEIPPRELILSALDAARWAPNHHRTEPWRFYLVGPATAEHISVLNAEIVRRKSGEAAANAKLRRWRAMPGWLAVTCGRHEDPAREREDYAACCCAVQNFLLLLWEAGVGSKWSTGKVTRETAYLAALGADPAHEFSVGIIWYGYPEVVPAQTRPALATALRELA